MPHDLDWQRDGPGWPHADRSRFVQAGGLHWHVQVWPGEGHAEGCCLLLHGTGASTHSWRDLAPLLARHATVVAVDLPGHAFTGMPPGGAGSPQLGLHGMARALGALLQALDTPPPDLLVGHSAGAAVAVRMALDGHADPQRIVGLNAALLPLGGLAGQWFSPAAKLMAALPLVPRLFAWRAQSPAVLQRLLAGTGSTLDAEGQALYHRLVTDADHAAGALGMMANWDLQTFARDLHRLHTPLLLLAATHDRTVPPAQALEVLARLKPPAQARVIELPGLGHLAHEEQPALVASHILAAIGEPAPTPAACA